MEHTDFKFFQVVSDILNDGDRHNEQTELNFLDLSVKLLLGSFF